MKFLMPTRARADRRRDGEDGFLLVAAVVMVALVFLALAVAAPAVARSLRRDKEVESMHRAQQYVRAIRLYTKRGAGPYPPSIEALEKSNNIRFLRQRYIDPLTGKDDWKFIHAPKTKTHIFFGEELEGLTPGLGSAASLQSTTGGGRNQGIGSIGGQTNCISAGGLASGFNGACTTTGSTGSTGSDPLASGSSGGIIMGVQTARTGESILTPNGQTTYETWEFWYDPKIEQLYKQANLLGGGGLGSTNAGSFGTGLNGLPGASGASGTTGTR